jgi:cyanophycinase
MKKITLLLALLASLVFLSFPVRAQDAPGLLIPIGGGYADIYAGFSQAAVANARNGRVKILVLAPTYSTNPEQITQAERQTNITDAEQRRFQIEEACKRAAPPEVTCEAILAPIFTRPDASNETYLTLFSDDLAAIFLLGGDQTVAMQVLANTPAEARLTELHRRGTIIAGTSAGGGMQSTTMLAGYRSNYASETALFFGAADVWNTAEKRGLPFGLQNAILDQHFHQRGRLGRLVNAILLPGVPHLGIGVDAYTGVIAEEETLRGVFGMYTVTILDAETYHAADAVRYVTSAPDRPALLSARNILVGLLSPGDFSYDLKTRVMQLGQSRVEPSPQLERSFDALTLPRGAGALILSGDISGSLEDNAILKRFIELAGGKQANLLVVALGGASASADERTAQRYVNALLALGADASSVVPDSGVEGFTGFVLVGRDASRMLPPEWLRDPWLAGKPVLADNAAATLLGSVYAAHSTTPTEGEEAEAATQQSFWSGKTNIQPGLGLVNITLQPQILADNRFGRWFALAYNHPDSLAVGLNKDTAIEITADGARVLGQNGIFVLDLRSATLALGENQGFVLANGLLDIFAPGELLQPEVADMQAVYQVQPTPVLSVAAATAEPTEIIKVATPLEVSTPDVTVDAVDEPAPPPAQSSPPYLGLVLGILLVIGAIVAARLFGQRHSGFSRPPKSGPNS